MKRGVKSFQEFGGFFGRLSIILHSLVAEMLCNTDKQVNRRASKIIVAALFKQTLCSANALFLITFFLVQLPTRYCSLETNAIDLNTAAMLAASQAAEQA